MKQESRRLRRRLDDVQSGLVFAWRTPGGSVGRTLIGVFVATVLFAGAASVLHVRIPISQVSAMEAAQVMILDPDDVRSRELIDWARFHSPYPDRWEPSGTGILDRQMQAVEIALVASSAYEPKLLPRMESEPSIIRRGLVDLEPYRLPPTRVEGLQPLKTRVAGKLQAVSTATGPLAERWMVDAIPWGGEERAGMVGLESSFLVGVEPGGRVAFCLVLNGIGAETDEMLQAWLRDQVLSDDPSAKDLVFDIVKIRIEEAPSEADKEGEVP